jgi:dienelactone hydrolase
MAQVSAFAEEMNCAGANWQLIVYGGAMHGFTHDAGPHSPGVAYHAESDTRSSRALEQFLIELFSSAVNTTPS